MNYTQAIIIFFECSANNLASQIVQFKEKEEI